MRIISTLIAISLVTASIQQVARAESYRGIGPYYTLNDVMAIFPGGKFEVLDAAWAQEWEYLYNVTGPGIDGDIVIKFDQMVAYYDSYKKKSSSEELQRAYDNIMSPYFEKPENQRLEVQWVRWLPLKPFPVSRMVTIYGEPSKKGVKPQNFQPYWEWEKRGVYATLDDSQGVLSVEYSFTEDEMNQATAKRLGMTLREYKKMLNGGK